MQITGYIVGLRVWDHGVFAFFGVKRGGEGDWTSAIKADSATSYAIALADLWRLNIQSRLY